MFRRWLSSVLGLAFVSLVLPGCGILGGGDSYTITVQFPRAVALYEESDVLVLGLPAGQISDVRPKENYVEVDLSVDADIPVPADALAVITPQALIGERSVALLPAWEKGMPKLADGDLIGVERTRVPVEPDDALQAFTDLARGLDPDAVTDLVTNSAEALDGRGELIGDSLKSAAGLTELLASEDEDLVSIAKNLDVLSTALTERNDDLARVLEGFATLASVLEEEQANVARLLDGLARLSESGNDLLDSHRAHLPEDIAQLTRTLLAAEVNLEAVSMLIEGLADNSEGLIDAYDAETSTLVQRINLTPITRELLMPLFENLGLDPSLVPCIPQPGVAC